jgi:hypothetical protein
MNERIKKLAEQAGFIPDNAPGMNSVLEKYAELIVRDCYVALFPALRDMISRGQAYDLIKKHFGVSDDR